MENNILDLTKQLLLEQYKNGKDHFVFSPWSLGRALEWVTILSTNKNLEELLVFLKTNIDSVKKVLIQDPILPVTERLEHTFDLTIPIELKEVLGKLQLDKVYKARPYDFYACLTTLIRISEEWSYPFTQNEPIDSRSRNVFYGTDYPSYYIGMKLVTNALKWKFNKNFDFLVELPYVKDSLTCTLIKPHFQDIERSILALDTFRDVMSQPNTELTLKAPSFEVDTHIDLSKTLYNSGLNSIFTPTNDWSIFNPDPDGIKIDRILQSAFLSFTKKGTKASALTKVVWISGCANFSFLEDKERVEINFNSPFLYVVSHKDIELPIFVGFIRNLVKQ